MDMQRQATTTRSTDQQLPASQNNDTLNQSSDSILFSEEIDLSPRNFSLPSLSSLKGEDLRPLLLDCLQKQLEFYFSFRNLPRDKYLLSQMVVVSESEAYVPLWVLYQFNHVQLILNHFFTQEQYPRDNPLRLLRDAAKLSLYLKVAQLICEPVQDEGGHLEWLGIGPAFKIDWQCQTGAPLCPTTDGAVMGNDDLNGGEMSSCDGSRQHDRRDDSCQRNKDTQPEMPSKIMQSKPSPRKNVDEHHGHYSQSKGYKPRNTWSKDSSSKGKEYHQKYKSKNNTGQKGGGNESKSKSMYEKRDDENKPHAHPTKTHGKKVGGNESKSKSTFEKKENGYENKPHAYHTKMHSKSYSGPFSKPKFYKGGPKFNSHETQETKSIARNDYNDSHAYKGRPPHSHKQNHRDQPPHSKSMNDSKINNDEKVYDRKQAPIDEKALRSNPEGAGQNDDMKKGRSRPQYNDRGYNDDECNHSDRCKPSSSSQGTFMRNDHKSKYHNNDNHQKSKHHDKSKNGNNKENGNDKSKYHNNYDNDSHKSKYHNNYDNNSHKSKYHNNYDNNRHKSKYHNNNENGNDKFKYHNNYDNNSHKSKHGNNNNNHNRKGIRNTSSSYNGNNNSQNKYNVGRRRATDRTHPNPQSPPEVPEGSKTIYFVKNEKFSYTVLIVDHR